MLDNFWDVYFLYNVKTTRLPIISYPVFYLYLHSPEYCTDVGIPCASH